MTSGPALTVVTGVHRSGTSAVSMTLEALGLDFGDHAAFYGADQWNQRGYFERTDVIDLNSRLLTGFPRTQGRISALLSQMVYLLPPSPRTVHRRACEIGDEIAQLATELDGIAVKDPRFCLTMNAWRPFVASCIVCLRHPSAVAQSLRRRQRIPLPLGFRFWDHHAAALLAAPIDNILYLDFDALGGRSSRPELARLLDFLGLDVELDDALEVFRDRFAPELRHFTTGETGDMPGPTRELWDALQARRG